MKWPAKLTGGHSLVPWLNQLLESAKSCQINPGVGYRINSQSLSGTVLGIGGAPPGAAGSFAIRGEYSPTVVYKLYDVAIISSGINQGTFVCIAPTAYNVAPYTGGGYWMQLPGGLLGAWM